MPINEKISSSDQVTLPHNKPFRKRLISGAFWSVVGRIASIGALFCAHALLARELSKPDYAAYYIVTSAVALLSMLVTLGIPQVLIRTIRDGRSAHSALRVRSAVINSFRLMLLSCGIVVVLLIIALQFLSDEIKWSGLREHAVLVSLWFSLSAFCYLLSSALQGLDDFRSAVLVGARNGGVIPNVLFFLTALAYSRYFPLDLGSVLLFQVAFFSISLFLAFGFVIRRLYASKNEIRILSAEEEASTVLRTDANADRDIAWLFRESWPNLINQLIATGLVELDIFWVAYFASESDIADYGVAKKLVLLVSAPLLMVAIALGPFVSELFHRGQLKRLERILRGSATVVGLPAFLALLLFLVVPESILDGTFGAAYRGATLPLRILAMGQIVFVVSGCNGLTLTMTGHQRQLLACSVLTFILYCLLAPMIISRWGAVGAAAIGSILFASQNIIVSITVKYKIGIWTIATLSPSLIMDQIRRLKKVG